MNKKFAKSFSLVAVGALIAGGAVAAGLRAQSATHPTGKVTPWEAIKLAKTKVSGTAFQVTYAYEGHWGYDVVIINHGKAKEVEIDATTGKIGDVESVTPADEAQELKSDMSHALKSL